MMRLTFFMLLVISLGACSQKSQSEKADTPQQRPNMVFIYVDDMGWADLSCYNNTYHESPRIDAFAQQGVRYTNAYAPAPVCSPARAGVFSGQYPARLGVTDWIPGHWRPYEKKLAVVNRTQHLPLEVETFGEALRDAGYKTGYFGKWHLGDEEEYFVDKQGFDDVVMYQGGGTYYGLNKKFYPTQQIEDSVYLTDALTNYAVDFLERNQDSTFFLVISHFAVHLPLEVPDSLYNQFKDKPHTMPVNNPWYAGMIKSLDNNIGRVLDKIDELNLADNTMIVFYSDNGGLHEPYRKEYLKYTRNQPVTSNKPLKGEKGNLYEGGIRVPMIVRWPGHTHANTVSDIPVSGIDLYPTFLEIAGVAKGNRTLDGQSMIPTFDGTSTAQDRALFWHYPVFHHGEPASAMRKGNYKVIKNYITEEVEIYDLSTDLGESKNIADQDAELTAKLVKELDSHLSEVKAELPKDNPDFDPKRRHEWGIHPDKEQNL